RSLRFHLAQVEVSLLWVRWQRLGPRAYPANPADTVLGSPRRCGRSIPAEADRSQLTAEGSPSRQPPRSRSRETPRGFSRYSPDSDRGCASSTFPCLSSYFSVTAPT